MSLPDVVKQFLFFDHTFPILNKVKEDIKGAGRKCFDVVTLIKAKVPPIDEEITKEVRPFTQFVPVFPGGHRDDIISPEGRKTKTKRSRFCYANVMPPKTQLAYSPPVRIHKNIRRRLKNNNEPSLPKRFKY